MSALSYLKPPILSVALLLLVGMVASQTGQAHEIKPSGEKPAGLQESNFVFVNKALSFHQAQLYCRQTYGTTLAHIQNTHAWALWRDKLTMQNGRAVATWNGVRRYENQFWRPVAGISPGRTFMHVHMAPEPSKNCVMFRAKRTFNGPTTASMTTSLCSNKNAFVCWAPKFKNTIRYFTQLDLRGDGSRPAAGSRPNCPTLKTITATIVEARNACNGDAACAGFLIQARYASDFKKRSAVRLLKADAQCRQERRVSSQEQSAGIIFFKQSDAF